MGIKIKEEIIIIAKINSLSEYYHCGDVG